MRFESKLDLTFKQLSEKHVTVSGLKGGNAYHFSIEAGLGEFDIKRLFFILPANEYRKKNYTLGPANIDFAGDNKYLPPRMNCFINGVFSYAIWFDAPSLVELLNDPEIADKIPEGIKTNINIDDGFGKRCFKFLAEGVVPVDKDESTVDLMFPDDFGIPEILSVSVKEDLRYERAKKLTLRTVSCNHPRLFINDTGESLYLELKQKSPDLLEGFEEILNSKLNALPVKRPVRNSDGEEHMDIFDRVGSYSFAYALKRKQQYYDEALKGVEWILSCEHWGMDKFMDGMYSDSAKSYINFGCDNDMCQGIGAFRAVIFFYDWCYDNIELSLKKRIENKLLKHGDIIFKHSMYELAEWPCQFTSDHNTGSIFPLQMLAFLLADKYEKAAFWLNWGRVFFEDSITRSFVSSNAYFSPQLRSPLLGYIKLCKDLLNEDLTRLFNPDPYIPARLMSCIPGKIDFALHLYYGCDAQLLFAVAALKKDGRAQWLAEKLSKHPIKNWLKTQVFRKVMELIFRDSSVAEEIPSGLPRHLHDPSYEVFWYRSSWRSLTRENNEIGETLIEIENKIPRLLMDKDNKDIRPRNCDGGNPFGGHFSIVRNDELFIEPPFGSYLRMTCNANAMLVDGFGQIGDGSWLFPHIAPEKFTKIVSVNIEQIVEDETIKKIYTIVQNLDPAYPEKMKLEYFRTFVICEKLNRNNSGNFEWMKIEDAVKSDKEHIYSFFCHSCMPIMKSGDFNFNIKGEKSLLNICFEADNIELDTAIADTEAVWTYIPPMNNSPKHIKIQNKHPICQFKLMWKLDFQDI